MHITPLDSWIAHKIGCDGQPLTRADLEAYQLAKLRTTLSRARDRSRFYRQHLADVPLVLNDLSDLALLPFTTADDLRNDPLQFLCVSQDEIGRVVTLDTSGTTGKPKRLYFTRDDQEQTIDFFQAGMSTFTDPGDRVLILLPGDTPGSVGDLLALGLERLGAVPIKHGLVRDATATLDIIRRENISVMVGVPTQVLALARHPVQPTLGLKSVLLSTDHVPDALKRAVENAWGCTVYNHYGMTEMGLGGGVECAARHGYHLREADLLFEIVDPATGQALPDGDEGEIVITTLTRRGMPLIRYRTGDVGRFIPDPCLCGTSLKRLDKVTHRLREQIWIGGRCMTMAELDEILFAVDGVVNFNATVSNTHGTDCLRLDVQVADSKQTQSVLQSVSRAFPAAAEFDVQVEIVSAIELRSLKRCIIDQRHHHEKLLSRLD